MAASGSPQSPYPGPQPQGDAYAIADATGRLLHWSLGAERLLGYPIGEVLGAPVTDLLGGRADTAGLDAGPPGHLGTSRLRRRDGGTVEVALWAAPLGDAGAGIGWLFQATRGDLARRAELDRALVNGLFTETPVAIGVFDTDRRFLALNQAGRSAW